MNLLELALLLSAGLMVALILSGKLEPAMAEYKQEDR